MTPALVWFRQDLRLNDNSALSAALDRGGPVVPVYILDDAGEGPWAPGAASRWWLHAALASLDQSLRERGSRLLVERGGSAGVIDSLLAATGARAVFWNRRYEPAAVARDSRIKASLAGRGIDARSFNSALLFEPHCVEKKGGGPFQVFTPFWTRCLELEVEPPVRLRPGPFAAPAVWPDCSGLSRLGLMPSVPWDAGLAEAWEPGEKGASKRLKRFVAGAVNDYAAARDRPDGDGTSKLSPRLHFGEVGPRQVWAAVRALSRESGVFPQGKGTQVFLKELGWREFAHHLLFHFPETPHAPLRADFNRFPWAADPGGALLLAWKKGRTGYPIVDAGMRQLWATGWMHNRVRMIVASFLVKHLRLSWTHGAAWFWDTLVDADLANNTLGWQWSAGCGADAAPYFRIFAPVRQGLRYDPQGDYVRRWVPELASMPAAHIHSPWEAPAGVLAAAGVRLGTTYPLPLVDHAAARTAALAAFSGMRRKADA